MSNVPASVIESAASAVREARGMVIGTGAGMGVDSGLPDFRGDRGFWKAYPAFEKLGLSFVDMANPSWFDRDPRLAWGFYGHRLELYRGTTPHEGFDILHRWAERMGHGCFVFTSNVDGQFQRAGYGDEGMVECHGSIHHLQCTTPCGAAIWENTDSLIVDPETCRASSPLPVCTSCDALARPNILMFGDGLWISDRTHEQEKAMRRWLLGLEGEPVVVIELGAGLAVPTVRWECEHIARQLEAPLIRINPGDPEGPSGTLSIPLGALEALRLIDERLE